MKITMSRLAKECDDYCSKWNKKATWDTHEIARECYVAGFKRAIEIVAEQMRQSNKIKGFHQTKYDAKDDEQALFMEYYIKSYIEQCGDRLIEIDIVSGRISEDNQ